VRIFRVFAASLLPLFVAVACLPGTAQAASSLPSIAEADIPNFAQVDENLYRGGMPSEQGLRQLKDAGVRTIISLANERKYVDGERAAAEKLGMHFIFIPLSAWRGPRQNDIDAFLSLVDAKDHAPIFVHCMHGQDRTGAMIAMYRMQHDGWTEKKAYDEMLDNGFHRVFFRMADTVKDFR
jgi:protein tyrosine/serine phosphatase